MTDNEKKHLFYKFADDQINGNYYMTQSAFQKAIDSALTIHGVVSSFCPCGKVTSTKDCHCPDADFLDNDLH